MELVEDEHTFVVVLIDEVVSLTAARAGAMAGTEPSDALRVRLLADVYMYAQADVRTGGERSAHATGQAPAQEERPGRLDE